MSVKKIFITLITVVACVMVGAFVLNVLMPNAISTGTNAIEDQLYRATGIKLDFNGDSVKNSQNNTYDGKYKASQEQGTGTNNGQNVGGFKK